MTEFPIARMIETNGIRLAVHEAGQGGIPLLLCHGWPELAFSWRYQVAPLVDAGYHVIIPDQRGYGDSDKPGAPEAYDCHQLTGDLCGLLDALGIEKAVHIGHDWGAIVVWHQVLLHPERVAGVANLSVPFRVREPADPVAFWEKRLGPDFYIVHFNRQPGVAAATFDANTDTFLRNMYRTRQWLDTKLAPAGLNIVDQATRSVNRGDLLMSEEELNVFVETFQKGGFTSPCAWYRNFTRNWETTADVPQRVRCPSLMIYGKYDSVPQVDMSPYVDDLEVHEFECGHWIQQEKPVDTNRVLLEWLDRRMKPLF